MVEQIWKERRPRRLLKLVVIFAPFWASRWASTLEGEKWGVLTFLVVLVFAATIVRSYWWVERPGDQEPPQGPIF
jgi:hypothetical protein